ncbi:LysR family transcriptional regulator [Piscinibacter gummiphilus]|uniref:LysR family transcriptional regulator n=1 Tax=Piscinibacter gummiphilus TaxID=946333 RepID=A0A1W6LGG3_9BURK|nr:LysR family transcriptional regulator [Piscinibacter gummiphilus]ARN23372.1 LysR family transcriptional regulator [Piscinibacter gummiphilus]ATU68075.1 LysR family transcriptional regulator [Piscinibacter gummiphilus]GLS97377.1 transcriptional regulator [Piscinibacter gummiphilus]
MEIVTRPGSDAGDGLASSFATSYAGVLAFMAVANEGNFARAGDRLGIGRSAVSRNVQRLEVQLNARLFHRTTRSISLTSEGELFFARCQPGVMHIAQAFEEMRDLREGRPRGRLRVSSSATFGRKVVAPLLAGFQEAHPEIELELLLDDARPEFIADRIDISFQNGRMEDSQVVAKQLVPMRMVTCASPAYAREHGLPRSLDELAQHRCVHLRLPSGRLAEWEFKVDGRTHRMLPPARSTFNDDDLVLQAALGGQGLAQLPAFQLCEPLQSGDLVTCLAEHEPDDRGHYICYPSRRQLPSRVRVFIDYMTLRIRAQHRQSMAFASGLGPIGEPVRQVA